MSESTELSSLDRFVDNMNEFIKLTRELLEKCYNNKKTDMHPIIVDAVYKFLANYDKEKLVYNFISYSEPFWGEIKKRDQNFFTDHYKTVFRDLPEQYVNSFKVLFTAKDDKGNFIVEQEDRDAIWIYFECLIKTCIHHIHDKRKPGWKNDKKIWTVDYHGNTKLQTWAKIYNVKLEWSL